MAEIQDLSAVAGSHARWPEGMAPSGVNDSARVDEGIIVRWFGDTNYSLPATLSGTVIQITANRASITLTGTTSNYMADLLMAFTSGSVTLVGPLSVNLNAIGPISLRDVNGVSLSATVAVAGTRCLITKDNTNNYFRLLSPAVSVTALNSHGNAYAATDMPADITLSAIAGSARYDVVVHFNGFLTNTNGTSITPKITVTIKDGVTTLVSREWSATVASGFANRLSFIMSFQVTHPAAGAFTVAITDTEADGGSHAWTLSASSASANIS